MESLWSECSIIWSNRTATYTADGKRLYVAGAGDGKTYVYRIRPDGSLADRNGLYSICMNVRGL